jgi:hypothetical protein
MHYYKVLYTTHMTSVFAGDDFIKLLRLDYFHLFSKGLITHLNNNIILMLDERLKNTHHNKTARDLIKDIINTRSTQTTQIIGFHKRFVQLKIGIFQIASPWGYQNEAFMISAPYTFTLELLQYGCFLSVADSKLLLSIVVNLRTLFLHLEPLINRVFDLNSVTHLMSVTSQLRSQMHMILPKVKYPKNHWLTTAVSHLLHHRIGQCDYLEAMHR